MGIVVLLESESIVNSLDFESTSSFESTSLIKIPSGEFNHTPIFECSDAFNGIVVNFYAHREFNLNSFFSGCEYEDSGWWCEFVYLQVQVDSIFEHVSSLECSNIYMSFLASPEAFSHQGEFSVNPTIIISEFSLNNLNEFSCTKSLLIVNSVDFSLVSEFEFGSLYDQDYVNCLTFEHQESFECDLLTDLVVPSFEQINLFNCSAAVTGQFKYPINFDNVSSLNSGLILTLFGEFESTNSFNAVTDARLIVPDFETVVLFNCSEVYAGILIIPDIFISNNTFDYTIFYPQLTPDFILQSSIECTKVALGEFPVAFDFNQSSEFEFGSLYDGDYLVNLAFENVTEMFLGVKPGLKVTFNSAFSFECFSVYVGTVVEANNFNSSFSFSANSSFLLNTLDFSQFNGFNDVHLNILINIEFSQFSDLICFAAFAGTPVPADNFELTSEFLSTAFFSINVLDFDENLTFDCYDVIYGYLFPIVDFELISEFDCDDVKKIWRLFAHTSGGQLAQGTHQINLTPLVLYEYSNYFANELSTEIVFFNSFHNSLRDSDLTFNQYSFNSLGLNKDQCINNSILDLTFKEQYISVPLANDSFISEHYIGGNLSGYNFVTTQFINLDIEYFGQTGSNGLASLWYDPPPGSQPGNVPVITYIYFDIFIDGISIKERIRDINLTQRESDVISHIEIEFKDTFSFNMCDVDQGTGIGTERIELRIGGDLSNPNKYTIYKFLLEERSANESNHSFTIWGRQITALLTEPFSEPITQTFKNRTSSSIAQELAGSINVNWTAYDNLNLEYNLDGTPLAGIQRLAEVVNAIVRTDPDGGIVVRPRFPVRPMDLIDGNCAIDITLDRYLNIVSADYSEEQSQYNTIEVQGGSSNDDTNISIVSYEEYNYNIPQEVVDAESKSDFQLDDIAYLRVYRNNNIIYDPTNQFDDSNAMVGYSLCTTFNSTNMIQLDNDELIEDEVVDIINGTGNLSKNPSVINSWHWEGVPKFGDCQEDTVIVSFDENNITAKDSNDNNVLIGKMKVTYTTRYDLFEITCDEEKEIIIAALTSEHLGVYLKVTMDSVTDPSEEKPAPKIDDDLITDETTALIRGQSILDDTYYKKRKHSIQIPFYLDTGLFDGGVVRMEDDFWGIIGNAIIRSADISINVEDSGVIKIWQNIELHQYARP